jgi:glycosyltransferase involved in cell wall biosynthesis
LLGAAFKVALTRPAQWAKALVAALQMGWRADRSLPYHLVYLLEACWLAEQSRRAGIRHMHAHFGTNSAEVVMLAHLLGGPGYSFTVHGPEEFDKPAFIGLARKIALSRFVVAISSFGRSQLFRQIPAAQWPKVQVVHCGIDDEFKSQAIADVIDTPRLLCIGRLCEQKGQLLLLQALRRVLDRGHAAQLVLAGDGEMRADIERDIAALGLSAHVTITGWISGQQVREELRQCRAMVLPSFAEGLPVVIMEAMALARPVVSTSIAGIPELVSHGETGWLCPAGDVDALADVLQACLQTPIETLRRMGEAGRERVLARHDVSVEAAKLRALFEESVSHVA